MSHMRLAEGVPAASCFTDLQKDLEVSCFSIVVLMGDWSCVCVCEMTLPIPEEAPPWYSVGAHQSDAFIIACGSGFHWTCCCLSPGLCTFWPELEAEDPEINQGQACLEELPAEGSGSRV